MSVVLAVDSTSGSGIVLLTEPFSGGGGSGTVTSVNVSGGTTGLTTSGGPVTTTGTITLGGTLGVPNGGTGANTLTGYLVGNGESPVTAVATIPNAGLTNSAITINGSSVSLGGSVTVTATASNALTISTGLTGTSYNGSTPVTIGIDSTVVTLNAAQTLTSKTLTSPIISTPSITGTFKLTGTGAATYTPFIQTFASSVTNYNGYQLNYIQNTNNGSDASVDYVAYNDSSDVDSYFIDMGISSSNYTNPIYTVFPANGAYVYTGGGTSGQACPLLLGTSNTNSDIIFFTGGTLTANTRGLIKGNGNFLINTSTDTGYKLNVNGTTYFGGASTFGGTVLLNANPTLALQAATKQYVDSAVSTGFVVHDPVVYATVAALPANTYNNGSSGVGATLTANANGALSVDATAVSVGQRILVKNEVAQANNGCYTVTATGGAGAPYVLTRATDFNTAAAGNIANNAYFFVTSGPTQAGDSYVLSQTAAITVGTTALPFTLFADQAVYTGGTNITVAGQVINVSGTIAATLGGTGTSTVTTGDLLYGSATNTWSKLSLGAAYKSLVVNAGGTQVEWNAVALNQTAAVSGQLGTGNGGTGFGTYAVGDLLYASSTSALSKLVVGTSGQVLTAGATIPQYVNQSTLSVGSSTNIAGGAAGSLPYNTGAGATSFLTLGSLGQVLTAGATAPQYVNQSTLSVGSAATLTTARAIYGNNFDGSAALTQVIASTYGGTGNGFTKFSGPATAERTFTLPNSNATILTSAATVTTAQGGTNLTSFTANGVVYASSSSALTTGTQVSWDGTDFYARGSSASYIRTGRTTNLGGAQTVGYFSFDAPNASGTPKGWGYIRAFTGSATAGSENSNLYFGNIQNGSLTDALTINYGGNIAIATLSSGWGSNYKAFEFANAVGFAALTSGAATLYVSNNAYNDGTDWTYRSFSAQAASQYRQTLGTHVWLSAPSGTGTITFTQQMTLDADDNLQMQAGAIMPYTPAPELITAAVTPLTNAQLQTQILQCSGVGAYTLTMPTGSTLDSLANWTQSNVGYDFIVINNRAAGTITMAVNTGVSSVGSLSVLANISARYRIRRTGVSNYVLCRIG